jgi:DNA-binding transcriptional ArsR family regulator
MEWLKNAAKRSVRSVEEAAAYAVAHRIRVEILCYLNEGQRSPSELAALTKRPLSTVEHHVKELLASGSIELARAVKVRNTVEHFYKAVEIPFYSDEAMWAMPFEARQKTYSLILQAIMGEAMASLWAGKISNDPRVWMTWRWFNLDARGRGDVADEQARHWERVQEIEAESTDRRAESGEEAVSIIVSSLGYERARTSQTPPATSGES